MPGKRQEVYLSIMPNSCTTMRNYILFLLFYFFSGHIQAQSVEELQEKIRTASDELEIARAESELGTAYFHQADFLAAQDHFFRSLKLAEKKGDSHIIASSYNNISATYFETENYPQAIEYARKAIDAFTKLEDHKGLANAYNSLGNVYYVQEEDSLCLHYFSASLQERIIAKDSIGLFAGYKNLGSLYFEMSDTARGIEYIKKSTRYIASKQDTAKWIGVYITLGQAYVYSGKLEQGKLYLDSCGALLLSYHDNSKREDYYYILYHYYNKKGDYKQAMASFEQYGNYRDSIVNATKGKQLAELNVKYETEKKETENRQLIAEKKRVLLFSMAAIVILSLLFYLVYHNRSIRNRSQEEQRLNQALFTGEQNERIRIARDLHDSVGQMLSLLKMNVSSSDQPDESTGKTLTLIDKAIDEVRSISHNLIPEDLNFGLFPALESLADKINSSGSTRMELDIQEEIRAQNFEKQNELSIYRIVQEVVNNMVKHAQASVIQFTIRQEGQKILISIKDNGRGLDADAIEKSSGIGWKNINARVNLLAGKMKVQSERLSGTQIEISIPN